MTGKGRYTDRMVVLGLVCMLLVSVPLPAASKLVLDVDNPNLAKMPIAVPDFVSSQPGTLSGRDLARIVKNDLYLSGLFHIVEAVPPAASGPGGEPNFDGWSQTGVQALVLGTFSVRGEELVLEVRVYEVALKKLEVGKRFTGHIRDHRLMIHRFDDRIMKHLTGVDGCFCSRLAFVGDAQSREVFVMDYDGHGLRQATRTGAINLSPDWSPDGWSLIFTSYANRKPDLWGLDLRSMRMDPISARPGLNASGRYSPDGGAIAMSLTAKVSPKLFILTSQGHIIKRLTNGMGNDISPTWSPDGSAIAYVSDQPGTPQIYRIPVNGGQPTRLTFGSAYNTDPDWSPRGDLLAFTSRVNGRFQVCTMRADGTDLRVLTDKGSNQDPAWAPNGRMMAFTSDRDGKKLIYIMDVRGEIQVPVSPITGKSPAWSRNLE